jgi:hypothetical protein
MASFGHTFDASQVEPNTSYEVLPPGKYLVQIVASEMRPTKDGMGQYLYLEIDVLEGQYTGRKLFDRLNLVNPSPDAVDIARRTLSALCRAVGKLQVNDSEQLHLIPLIADVRVRPPKGEYGESNSIRYLPRNGVPASSPRTAPARAAAPAPVAAAPAPAPTPAATAAANGLPWKRQG